MPTQTPSKKGIGNYEFLLTDVIGEGFSSVVYKGKSSTKGEICNKSNRYEKDIKWCRKIIIRKRA